LTAEITPSPPKGQRAASEKSANSALQTTVKLPDGESQDGQDAAPEGISLAPAETRLAEAKAASYDKSHGGNDKAAADFHRVVAELTAGHDTPTPDRGNASTAAAAANSGPAAGVAVQSSAATVTAPASDPASTQAQSPAVAVPLAGLAVEIVTQVRAGKNHFDIRLDPPELGRINVKLDVDRDGNVATQLVVDRSDTLDLLKRDASTLERALQQAGLKTSDHGLDFSLRQHAFAEQDATPRSSARMVVPDDDNAPLDALRQGYGRLLGLGGGLDIRV
jgi:flagellar hook-length control protein FliK